jgi:hypothetical protein
LSEWLLFDTKCTIFQLFFGENKLHFDLDQHISWISIVLAHWNNSPKVDILLHSGASRCSYYLMLCNWRSSVYPLGIKHTNYTTWSMLCTLTITPQQCIPTRVQTHKLQDLKHVMHSNHDTRGVFLFLFFYRDFKHCMTIWQYIYILLIKM